MKEPKYRYWNSAENKMYYQTAWGWDNFPKNNIVGSEWLQFTGLLDKNGKEIYEGDLIRTFYDNGYVATMEVKMGEFGWCPFCDIVNGDYRGHPDDFEIIGNIYESPELTTTHNA